MTNIMEPRSHFGIPNLLVLTVTLTDEHRRGIMASAQQMMGSSAAFLFGSIGAQGLIKPSHGLLTEPWERVGYPPLSIGAAG
jgi:hypothetical protein